MARISVWFVRAALLHFAIGSTVGAWGLAARSGTLPAVGLPIRPLHVDVMLIGWVCQLAVGVALWILPFSRAVSDDRRFWSAWGLLNGGIAMVAIAKGTGTVPLELVGRVSELIAGGLLVWGLFPRVRPLPQRSHS